MPELCGKDPSDSGRAVQKNAGNPWEVRKSSAGTAAERGTASTAVLRRTVTTGNLRLP